MDFSSFHPSSWPFFTSPILFPSIITPEDYVHWTETLESHVYTAVLTGARKEEIRVEVEDSLYLVIRTEAIDEAAKPARSFMRKFRLPGMIHIGGISAGYEDGVLTVTVPKSFTPRRFRLDSADLSERHEVLAPAA